MRIHFRSSFNFTQTPLRSYTCKYTHTHAHSSQRAHTTRRLSTSDVTTSSSTSSSSTTTATTSATDQSVTDDLQNHIMLNAPKKGEVDVPLGSSITVHFDKDVKTVNINKLFEVVLLFSSGYLLLPIFLFTFDFFLTYLTSPSSPLSPFLPLPLSLSLSLSLTGSL